MKSLQTLTTAFLFTIASSQAPYGSGTGSSSPDPGSAGPVTTSCPTQFFITSFSASCTPHGEGCSCVDSHKRQISHPAGPRRSSLLTLCNRFRFDVATNASLSSPVTCSASFNDVAMELPLVPFTLCTEDHTIVWGWAPMGPPNGTATDYSLMLTDSEWGLAAAKIWPASDYPMARSGASMYQEFNGSASFTM